MKTDQNRSECDNEIEIMQHINAKNNAI